MSLQLEPGLHIIPYLRGRLSFSRMTAEAVAATECDVLAVDLPHWLDPLLPVVLDRLPLVTALLIHGETTCSILPFSPADPACAAAWLARRRGCPIVCVDDPEIPWEDQDRALECDLSPPPDHGLERTAPQDYFEPLWRRLDELWTKVPGEARLPAALRAARVATRLRALQRAGGRVALVCEYRLGWLIARQWKGAESPGPDPSPRERHAALIFEDPRLVWSAGFFDDFPALVCAFFEALRAGNSRRFDPQAILKEILGGFVDPNQAVTRTPGELLDCVASLAGFRRTLECARRLLAYPKPTAADAGDSLPAFFTPANGSTLSEAASFPLPDVLHCKPFYPRSRAERTRWAPEDELERRLKWVGWAEPFITRQEARELRPSEGRTRFAVAEDYRLHTRVCEQLRDFLRQNRPACPPLDKYTPTVFLFANPGPHSHAGLIHDSSPALRRLELGNAAGLEDLAAQDRVFTVYYTRRGRHVIHPHVIEREQLSSLALLYTGEETGPDRYAVINALPRDRQCRTEPEEDPELSHFPPAERAVAWAVKYADRAIIVIHYEGWTPSLRLLACAAARGVSLVTADLHVLSAELVARLEFMHYISPALKKHPHLARIVTRFVPPFEGPTLKTKCGAES